MVNGSSEVLRSFVDSPPRGLRLLLLSFYREAQAVHYTFSCYPPPPPPSCRHMVPVSWPTTRQGAGSQQICFSAATITRNVQLQQPWGKGDGCFFFFVRLQTSDCEFQRVFLFGIVIGSLYDYILTYNALGAKWCMVLLVFPFWGKPHGGNVIPPFTNVFLDGAMIGKCTAEIIVTKTLFHFLLTLSMAISPQVMFFKNKPLTLWAGWHWVSTKAIKYQF